jgi:hypothetical protein
MIGLEVGAEVTFECEVCGWGNSHEIGGPGADHLVEVRCPNPSCDAKYDVKLEVEPLQSRRSDRSFDE